VGYIGRTNLNDYSETYNNLGSLGISVSVKIPKSVNDLIKQVPDIRSELKQAGSDTQAQVARTLATGESIVRTVQVVGVILAFGAIISAVLLREKKS
jgi:hypothetical protein